MARQTRYTLYEYILPSNIDRVLAMREVSPLEPVTSAAITQRRERLTDRIRKSGCRAWRIKNSMQELLAISYLNKMGREARSELLSALNASHTQNEAEAASSAATDFRSAHTEGKEAPVQQAGRGASDQTSSSGATSLSPMPSLFEKSLSTTGRVISEQT